MENVAFVGLGGMGGGMAQRLAGRTGVRVFDLSLKRCQAITGSDVTIAADPADAVAPGGVLITMLPDDKALHAVVDGPNGTASRLGAGGLHINTSTVSPGAARAMEAVYAETGGSYLSAPVWGRPGRAASGQLVCALAGPQPAKDRALPLLEAMMARVEDLGTSPHLANVAKVTGNFLVASAIEALGEALAMAGKHGIDRRALLSLLTDTLFDCPVYRTYGPLVAEQSCPQVGFTVTLGRKDLRLIRETAAEVDAPMPLASIVEHHLTTAVARGYADEDWSALSWVAFEEAGIPHTG
jgi:3-hydroxyisobutyrate dehydrogenase-like beta-hydroxyacid dehydrogenase